MTKLEADLPDKYSLGDSWGIGWIRFGWDWTSARRARRQTPLARPRSCACYRKPGSRSPCSPTAATPATMYYELYREIFAELAGVGLPAAIEPPADPVEADITPAPGRL